MFSACVLARESHQRLTFQLLDPAQYECAQNTPPRDEALDLGEERVVIDAIVELSRMWLKPGLFSCISADNRVLGTWTIKDIWTESNLLA